MYHYKIVEKLNTAGDKYYNVYYRKRFFWHKCYYVVIFEHIGDLVAKNEYAIDSEFSDINKANSFILRHKITKSVTYKHHNILISKDGTFYIKSTSGCLYTFSHYMKNELEREVFRKNWKQYKKHNKVVCMC